MYHVLLLLPISREAGGEGKTVPNGQQPKPELTWIHEIFQGTFTSETRCINCETVRVCFFFFPIFWIELHTCYVIINFISSLLQAFHNLIDWFRLYSRL